MANAERVCSYSSAAIVTRVDKDEDLCMFSFFLFFFLFFSIGV